MRTKIAGQNVRDKAIAQLLQFDGIPRFINWRSNVMKFSQFFSLQDYY